MFSLSHTLVHAHTHIRTHKIPSHCTQNAYSQNIMRLDQTGFTHQILYRHHNRKGVIIIIVIIINKSPCSRVVSIKSKYHFNNSKQIQERKQGHGENINLYDDDDDDVIIRNSPLLIG